MFSRGALQLWGDGTCVWHTFPELKEFLWVGTRVTMSLKTRPASPLSALSNPGLPVQGRTSCGSLDSYNGLWRAGVNCHPARLSLPLWLMDRGLFKLVKDFEKLSSPHLVWVLTPEFTVVSKLHDFALLMAKHWEMGRLAAFAVYARHLETDFEEVRFCHRWYR